MRLFPVFPGQQSLWSGTGPSQGCLPSVVVQKLLWRASKWAHWMGLVAGEWQGKVCGTSKVHGECYCWLPWVTSCWDWRKARKMAPASCFAPAEITFRSLPPSTWSKISQSSSHISCALFIPHLLCCVTGMVIYYAGSLRAGAWFLFDFQLLLN